MYCVMRYVLSFLFCIAAAFAMVADGVHKDADYIAQAKINAAFESACSVHDDLSHTMQTGILIAPDVVATAAHGVAHMVKARGIANMDESKAAPVKGVFIALQNGGRVGCSHVIIDHRYLDNAAGVEAKYDIAFLKLERPLTGYTLPVLHKTVVVDKTKPAYVVTLGNMDAPYLNGVARAFTLHEFDFFHSNPYDNDTLDEKRSVLVSSLFFAPADQPLQTSPMDSEEKQRQADALQHWLRAGKLAYGLALPGTSGSAVFMHLKDSPTLALVGIVTSYARLGGGGEDASRILLQNITTTQNHYQTIFALLYRENTLQGDASCFHLVADPYTHYMIQLLRKSAFPKGGAPWLA
jgi:hypothetical protein